MFLNNILITKTLEIWRGLDIEISNQHHSQSRKTFGTISLVIILKECLALVQVYPLEPCLHFTLVVLDPSDISLGLLYGLDQRSGSRPLVWVL